MFYRATALTFSPLFLIMAAHTAHSEPSTVARLHSFSSAVAVQM